MCSGLPLVAREQVCVQVGVGVAEDLVVHPAERRVDCTAGVLDRLAECVHAVEELQALALRQVREPVDARVVDQQDAVPGEELGVPDDGVRAGQLGKHRGVGAGPRGADAVQLPGVALRHAGQSTPLPKARGSDVEPAEVGRMLQEGPLTSPAGLPEAETLQDPDRALVGIESLGPDLLEAEASEAMVEPCRGGKESETASPEPSFSDQESSSRRCRSVP